MTRAQGSMVAASIAEHRSSVDGSRRFSRAAALAAAVLLGLSTVPLRAHDPGLSSLDVLVDADRVTAVMSMAAADARLVTITGQPIDEFAAAAIEVSIDGTPLPAERGEHIVESDGGVRAMVVYGRAAGSRLTVRTHAIARLARGHRQLLTVRSATGAALAERMLDLQTSALDVDLAGGAPSSRAVMPFVDLGVRHILGGYDHVLFLAALLLGVGRLRSVVVTVTAFTVAHSLTLSAAILDLVRVPGAIVEPLIAVSVVYVGVENLIRGQMDSRWKLTFAFGLLHGFGFAGALQDLGVGGSTAGTAVALASFNAGVEAGQIAIALLLWPLIRQVNARPALRLRLVPSCSLLIVAAGCYWLAERTMW